MNTMCKTNEKKQKCVPVVVSFFFMEEGKERKGKERKGKERLFERRGLLKLGVHRRRSSSPINEEKRRVKKNGATRV